MLTPVEIRLSNIFEECRIIRLVIKVDLFDVGSHHVDRHVEIV